MFEYRAVAAPYPGLRAFEPHESEIFFGREGHTERLLEILQRERFLAVIGPSGCGKSSLVRAGLLPGLASGALGTGSHWRLALLRPGAQPLLALARALLSPYALGREILDETFASDDPEAITPEVALIADELRRGPESLAVLVRRAATRRAKNQPPFNLLVLVDQFEEVFTYARETGERDSESEAFVDLLLSARADFDARIYCAITMRTDFLGQCVRFLPLPEAINRAQYLTPRLNRAELRLAITGPARVFGGDVEPGLTEQLIEAIQSDSDQLPVLQHALARIRERGTGNRGQQSEQSVTRGLGGDFEGFVIDAEGLRAVGGIERALDEHAEAVYGSLGRELQRVAEILFRAITERREVGQQDVRRPQSVSEIAGWGEVSVDDILSVVKVFAAPEVCFLHHGRELNSKSMIDLSHEALMRKWTRLGEWIADECQRAQGYRRWSQRALEHAEKPALLVGGDLARALDWWNPDRETWQASRAWASRYASAEAMATEFECTREFLIASRDADLHRREAERKRLEQEAETERRRADAQRKLANEARVSEKRARKMTRVAFVVAVFALVLAGVAFVFKLQASQAEKQRTISLFESQLTHASLLARVEDFAQARRVLADSTKLDADIRATRQHARNLLWGYVEIMGGEAEQVYEGAGAALTGGVAVSPDGTILAAAGERGTLALFDAKSGRLLKKFEGLDPNAGHFGAVYSIAFDAQGRSLFSGGEDGRILHWSVPEGKKLSEWQAPDQVWAIASSPDGSMLASGGPDHKISLWSVQHGKKIGSLEGHTGAIAARSGLAFSKDGRRLASASYDHTARIWDVANRKSLYMLEGHADAVEAVAFGAHDKMLATASSDKQIMLWNAESGDFVRILRGHSNRVFGLAFAATHRNVLFSASEDRSMRLWDFESGITTRIFQGHDAGLLSVAVHGEQVYTAANDATLRRWNARSPDQWIWESSGSPAATAISDDARMLAIGFEDGALRLYHIADGKLLIEQNDAHPGSPGIRRIAFHRNLLATAGSDSKAKIWRVETDPPKLILLHRLEGHTDWVHAVAFSMDGKRLATASYDGQIGIFDVASGKGRFFAAHAGRVMSVAFNPEGNRLLSAGYEDRRLLLWNLDDPKQLHREIGQARDYLLWASLSPNGREAAAVGRGSTVLLYDLTNPAEPRRLVGHEQAVYRAIYSPDGRQLATVSSDMTVRVWDIETLHLLFTLRLPTQREHGVPLWDFDFRCTEAGDCWIAVPLNIGRLALYKFPYTHAPQP